MTLLALRNDMASVGANIIREIVIPELTREVNENKNFAQLRQVYNSLILATWYKKKIKDSILTQVYEDRNKTAGIDIYHVNKQTNKQTNPSLSLSGSHNQAISQIIDPQLIYQRYLQAFKKGVYNYIKEEQNPVTQEVVPRKYFSGGVNCTTLADAAMTIIPTLPDAAQNSDNDLQLTIDMAMTNNLARVVNKKDLVISTKGLRKVFYIGAKRVAVFKRKLGLNADAEEDPRNLIKIKKYGWKIERKLNGKSINYVIAPSHIDDIANVTGWKIRDELASVEPINDLAISEDDFNEVYENGEKAAKAFKKRYGLFAKAKDDSRNHIEIDHGWIIERKKTKLGSKIVYVIARTQVNAIAKEMGYRLRDEARVDQNKALPKVDQFKDLVISIESFKKVFKDKEIRIGDFKQRFGLLTEAKDDTRDPIEVKEFGWVIERKQDDGGVYYVIARSLVDEIAIKMGWTVRKFERVKRAKDFILSGENIRQKFRVGDRKVNDLKRKLGLLHDAKDDTRDRIEVDPHGWVIERKESGSELVYATSRKGINEIARVFELELRAKKISEELKVLDEVIQHSQKGLENKVTYRNKMFTQLRRLRFNAQAFCTVKQAEELASQRKRLTPALILLKDLLVLKDAKKPLFNNFSLFLVIKSYPLGQQAEVLGWINWLRQQKRGSRYLFKGAHIADIIRSGMEWKDKQELIGYLEQQKEGPDAFFMGTHMARIILSEGSLEEKKKFVSDLRSIQRDGIGVFDGSNVADIMLRATGEEKQQLMRRLLSLRMTGGQEFLLDNWRICRILTCPRSVQDKNALLDYLERTRQDVKITGKQFFDIIFFSNASAQDEIDLMNDLRKWKPNAAGNYIANITSAKGSTAEKRDMVDYLKSQEIKNGTSFAPGDIGTIIKSRRSYEETKGLIEHLLQQKNQGKRLFSLGYISLILQGPMNKDQLDKFIPFLLQQQRWDGFSANQIVNICRKNMAVEDKRELINELIQWRVDGELLFSASDITRIVTADGSKEDKLKAIHDLLVYRNEKGGDLLDGFSIAGVVRQGQNFDRDKFNALLKLFQQAEVPLIQALYWVRNAPQIRILMKEWMSKDFVQWSDQAKKIRYKLLYNTHFGIEEAKELAKIFLKGKDAQQFLMYLDAHFAQGKELWKQLDHPLIPANDLAIKQALVHFDPELREAVKERAIELLTPQFDFIKSAYPKENSDGLYTYINGYNWMRSTAGVDNFRRNAFIITTYYKDCSFWASSKVPESAKYIVRLLQKLKQMPNEEADQVLYQRGYTPMQVSAARKIIPVSLQTPLGDGDKVLQDTIQQEIDDDNDVALADVADDEVAMADIAADEEKNDEVYPVEIRIFDRNGSVAASTIGGALQAFWDTYNGHEVSKPLIMRAINRGTCRVLVDGQEADLQEVFGESLEGIKRISIVNESADEEAEPDQAMVTGPNNLEKIAIKKRLEALYQRDAGKANATQINLNGKYLFELGILLGQGGLNKGRWPGIGVPMPDGKLKKRPEVIGLGEDLHSTGVQWLQRDGNGDVIKIGIHGDKKGTLEVVDVVYERWVNADGSIEWIQQREADQRRLESLYQRDKNIVNATQISSNGKYLVELSILLGKQGLDRGVWPNIGVPMPDGVVKKHLEAIGLVQNLQSAGVQWLQRDGNGEAIRIGIRGVQKDTLRIVDVVYERWVNADGSIEWIQQREAEERRLKALYKRDVSKANATQINPNGKYLFELGMLLGQYGLDDGRWPQIGVPMPDGVVKKDSEATGLGRDSQSAGVQWLERNGNGDVIRLAIAGKKKKTGQAAGPVIYERKALGEGKFDWVRLRRLVLKHANDLNGDQIEKAIALSLLKDSDITAEVEKLLGQQEYGQALRFLRRQAGINFFKGINEVTMYRLEREEGYLSEESYEQISLELEGKLTQVKDISSQQLRLWVGQIMLGLRRKLYPISSETDNQRILILRYPAYETKLADPLLVQEINQRLLDKKLAGESADHEKIQRICGYIDGSIVRLLRVQVKLSAEDLGLETKDLLEIEQGNRIPEYYKLEKIRKAFKEAYQEDGRLSADFIDQTFDQLFPGRSAESATQQILSDAQHWLSTGTPGLALRVLRQGVGIDGFDFLPKGALRFLERNRILMRPEWQSQIGEVLTKAYEKNGLLTAAQVQNIVIEAFKGHIKRSTVLTRRRGPAGLGSKLPAVKTQEVLIEEASPDLKKETEDLLDSEQASAYPMARPSGNAPAPNLLQEVHEKPKERTNSRKLPIRDKWHPSKRAYKSRLEKPQLEKEIESLLQAQKQILILLALRKRAGLPVDEQGIRQTANYLAGCVFYLLRTQLGLDATVFPKKSVFIAMDRGHDVSGKEFEAVLSILQLAYEKDQRLSSEQVEGYLRAAFNVQPFKKTAEQLKIEIKELLASKQSGAVLKLLRTQAGLTVRDFPDVNYVTIYKLEHSNDGRVSARIRTFIVDQLKAAYAHEQDGRLTGEEISGFLTDAYPRPDWIIPGVVMVRSPARKMPREEPIKKTSGELKKEIEHLLDTHQSGAVLNLLRIQAGLRSKDFPGVSSQAILKLERTANAVLRMRVLRVIVAQLKTVYEVDGRLTEKEISNYLIIAYSPDMLNIRSPARNLPKESQETPEQRPKKEIKKPSPEFWEPGFITPRDISDGFKRVSQLMEKWAAAQGLNVLTLEEKLALAKELREWVGRQQLSTILGDQNVYDTAVYMVDETGRLGLTVKGRSCLSLLFIVNARTDADNIFRLKKELINMFGGEKIAESNLVLGDTGINIGKNSHFEYASKSREGFFKILNQHQIKGNEGEGIAKIRIVKADARNLPKLIPLVGGLLVYEQAEGVAANIRKIPMGVPLVIDHYTEFIQAQIAKNLADMNVQVKTGSPTNTLGDDEGEVDEAMMTKHSNGIKFKTNGPGGIDLTTAHMNVETKVDSRLRGNDRGMLQDDKTPLTPLYKKEGEIKFHLSPAMLAQLQNAPGFVPVIINIEPLGDIRIFLGIKEQKGIQV